MHDAVVHLHVQRRSCSSRSRLHRRLAQAVAPRRTTESEDRCLDNLVAGIPLIWVSISLVVSFATTPLILVLIRLRQEHQRWELYLVHDVGPSVREALRKV